MIAIVNITQPCEPTGMHTYSLRINHREVCQFEHRREDGLADCLQSAAFAVKKKSILELASKLAEESCKK